MYSPEQGQTLWRLEKVHPGLSTYLDAIARYLRFPKRVIRQRFAAGVNRVGIDLIDRACRDWEAAGVLPHPDRLTQDRVSAIWSSPIFDIIMDDCLQFTPDVSTNIRSFMAPPCQTEKEAKGRYLQSLLRMPYWQAVLPCNMPDYYLEPFLPSGPLEGCDLACGWGRIALTLKTYVNRRLHCCDLTPKYLSLLSRLAANAGIAQHIIPHQCDVTHLPFANNSIDFFLAFDIFEHLTDQSLDACFREILRTAKPGAVIYTETPMHNYNLAITHIQDYSAAGFISRFTNLQDHGKKFVLERFIGDDIAIGHGLAGVATYLFARLIGKAIGAAAHQFTFRITSN